MKTIKTTLLSMALTGLLPVICSGFEKPGEAAIDVASSSPRQLITMLNGAETADIIDVSVKVVTQIEQSVFPETIAERLVVATAISVAKAGEAAPEVATALLEATLELKPREGETPAQLENRKKRYLGIIAATAVLISGDEAEAVKAALLEAAPDAYQEIVAQAINNPVDLVLGRTLGQLAINSAVDAVASLQTTSDRIFGLPARGIGGIPGEEYVPRGEFYFGQRVFDSTSGRFIRPAFVFTDSTISKPSGTVLSEGRLREQQTLPFDDGFVTDRGSVFPNKGTTFADRPGGQNARTPAANSRTGK